MTLSYWVLAIRPKTLPAAIAPVMIGTAMAWGDGVFHMPSAIACAFGALMIQIATNLVNDYCDFKKGADTADRKGPVRVTQAGLIKPKTVLMAAGIALLLAIAASGYLYTRGKTVILIIAIVSILSGIFYTAGKKPLGYLGLGDLFVFIFFGPVAVCGTYYVQALDMNMSLLLAGIAPGALSCAILAVNNLRDIDTDKKAGKKTLAVRFGANFAKCEYIACIMLAMLTPFIVFFLTHDHQGIVVASLVGFFSIPLIITVCTSNDGAVLNGILAKTGKLLIIYSMLYSMGWMLWSR